MLNTNNLTRVQKKGLNELGKILNTKFEGKLEPLSNHLDLIEKEWTSKRGITFVKVNGTQLEKDSIKYYSIDMDTILRYKQLTGIVELFKNVEYSKSWEVGKFDNEGESENE